MKKQSVSVCGFLTNQKDQLLIAKRSDNETFMPGMWELIGGGIDYGETPYQALQREFREELSIDIEPLFPYYSFSYLNNEETGKAVHEIEIDMYVKMINVKQKLVLDQNTHSELRWVGEAEIDSLFKRYHIARQKKSIEQGFKNIFLLR